MSMLAKCFTEVTAFASLLARAFFISPFNRKDTALLNMLIIAKKGPSFNLHALLEYDHAMKEELSLLRSRMNDRTSNFQDEMMAGQKRLEELMARVRSEDIGPEELIRMKSEMDSELQHLRSEWNKWKNLIEDELHSQRDIGGKIKEAWYALTPKDPTQFTDATEVVAAVISEREKLKEGWIRLKQEQDQFFEKVKENSERHLEIDRAWKSISYAQKSIKDERDGLKKSWDSLKKEQEDIIKRFHSVEENYQQIDNAWKELSYTQKTLSKAQAESQVLSKPSASVEIKIPKAHDRSLELQQENLKRDFYEKQAGLYMGDISSHFKEAKKSEPHNNSSVDEVLGQIMDLSHKSKIILEGEHPFRLPERASGGSIKAFYYQGNIYDFWRWLQQNLDGEVILIGPADEDPLWERTLDFLTGKGAKLAHFPLNVTLVKRPERA